MQKNTRFEKLNPYAGRLIQQYRIARHTGADSQTTKAVGELIGLLFQKRHLIKGMGLQ